MIIRGGQNIYPAEIEQHLVRQAEMEAYRIPDRVELIGDFPRSAQGKPQKYRLREAALQETKRGEGCLIRT